MIEYPKIHSLWKREGFDFEKTGIKPNGKHLLPGNYACDEFANIRLWDVEEKIDGTNIRIIFKNGTVRIGGRTKDAQIPTFLLDYLQARFTDSLMQARFRNEDGSHPEVILFGEGYGPKIQSGGYYSDKVGFCLFDIKIGNWWLEKDVIRHEIAEKLGVKTPPCLLTDASEEEVIWLVREKQFSRFAMFDPKHEHTMEGVVCRPKPLMLFRNGDPIMWKLKCKDFDKPWENLLTPLEDVKEECTLAKKRMSTRADEVARIKAGIPKEQWDKIRQENP